MLFLARISSDILGKKKHFRFFLPDSFVSPGGFGLREIMTEFIGRTHEMQALNSLKDKSTASLIVCQGRRRIGKSTLIREFGKSFPTFLEFQGLAPAKAQTNQDQLDNFISQLKKQVQLPALRVSNWQDALDLLVQQLTKRSTLILFDEISWMGQHDPNFAGKLKLFWDSYHRLYPKLIICLCGSVSSWIEDNILKATHFVGRISLTLTLRPLNIKEANLFFRSGTSKMTTWEKLNYLAVVGGIPKYLEELNLRETFNDNLSRLAFKESGFLFGEFDKLFNNAFESQKDVYLEILKALQTESHTLTEIIKKIGREPGGNYSRYIEHLELAGFITRDPCWTFKGEPSKSPRIRLSDNYTRFYFRCIKPNINRIANRTFDNVSLGDLANWRSIMGLQFENMIYDNLPLIIAALKIDPRDVINAGPYIQRKTEKNKGGCQVDLLIQTKLDTSYLCELKFRRNVSSNIIKEVQNKIRILQRPKYIAIRPVLIYAGELSEEIEASDFFYRTLDVGSLVD
jgi:AAA+ ATPase superfamily predicted ATPase